MIACLADTGKLWIPHERHHTALIFLPPNMSTQTIDSKNGLVHGLTAIEIQKLGQRCTEAKEQAYCKLPAPPLPCLPFYTGLICTM